MEGYAVPQESNVYETAYGDICDGCSEESAKYKASKHIAVGHGWELNTGNLIRFSLFYLLGSS